MKSEMPGVYDQLEAALRDMPHQLGVTPAAVLVVTAHWEEQEFSVSSHPNPPMIYDFGGFPEHTYRIRYDAPGSPKLARRVQELLQTAGLASRLDDQRGFDHGTFTPLFPIYPTADVPIVQLSLQRDFDPATHLAAGRALAPLRREGILIIGSGLSYHNLRQFGPHGAAPSRAFDQWLHQTLVDATPRERTAHLIAWAQAPAARLAHPREDHLMPLMVAVGAAEDETAHVVYHEDAFMDALTVSSFRFGM